MLIEFSVANFRSFLERQTFSMVAGSEKDHGTRHSFEVKDKAVSRLLRSAAVYGPNAAGKSNLVLAMGVFWTFVLNSAKQTQEGEKIDAFPFKLIKKSTLEPSEFEAVFIKNGTRYQYGFSIDENRVWEEWLYAVPSRGRIQRWFERTYNKDKDNYDWYINPSLKGKRQVWKESTRDNALFLSSAVQLKSESLREPFNWFQEEFGVISSTEKFSVSPTAKKCQHEESKEKVLSFLKCADLGISDIVVREREVTSEQLPDDLPEELIKQALSQKHLEVLSKHKDEDGDDVIFPFTDESDGTNVLFSLAFPFLYVLEGGGVLVVDELHNSLHPHMLRFLVGLFQDPDSNPNKAQLIFTTHDTSLMSGDFMKRDQFWLAEKDKRQATKLVPLLEFKPRKGEALERGYLGGRYGALPKIKELT